MKNWLSFSEVHEALDRKELSVVELTQKYLEAAKTEKLNAYLTLCEERAISQARVADQLISQNGSVPRDKYPLLGIPLGIKDILTIQGVRTTCASRILENYIPPYTATAVARLETAGSITLGKLNLDEFAMGGSNENSAFGPVQHPTHPGRVPGGSSGGSAAALKGGLCLGAIGTDTGGSVRLPASFCGVVGLKPTYGRVSRYGLVAFGSSLDQIGPLTHTVQDAAILLDTLVGHDPRDSTSSNMAKSNFSAAAARTPEWARLRIGVPREYFVGGLAPEVEKAIQDSLRWMEAQGAKLVPISLPHTSYAVSVYYLVAVSEASSNLARFDGVRFGVRPPAAEQAQDLKSFYQAVRAQFGPEVKRRIILGTFALSSGYYDAYYHRACQVRRLIQEDFNRAFADVDLIASPVAPTTAFKMGEKTSDPLQMYLMDIFTIPANLAGIPAISVPCGADSQGLPIGLQLIGKAFGEADLLSTASAFEKGRA